ncbi:MAG TPA: ribonuclease J [Patescibacteria group bacterium]
MGLKFIAISGTTGVTQNCYVYEYGNDMIVVDCGVGFPEPEMYGVDLIIPDFSYIIQNKSKLKGIVISHGHEDHLGALPFLLKEVNVPIYSTELVAGFIEDKFEDQGIKAPKVNIFNPERDSVTLGVFKITPFRVSHSVPDGVGFCIDTPEGKVFHVPDYKFDWTPVDGKPFDVAKAASLASEGALMLASDALGSTTAGYTESEKSIEGRIEMIVSKATKQVFFTTISSNISRIQQAINVASRLGRKVSIIGRSIDRKAAIAKELGLLKYPENLVINPKQAGKLDPSKIMYIISGSYGQPGSALYRTALGEHDFLQIDKEDIVIFSSDPAPPGSKTNVDFVVDHLIEAGADVHYYEIQEDLHVSGHGCQEDIKMLFALIKPKYFIPIGGTIRHMRAFSEIAQDMGASANRVFELREGDVVEFANQNAKKTGHIQVKNVLVDGLGIGDVGNVVLRDRHVLAKEGVVIAILHIDSDKQIIVENPDLVSRGFVFEGKNSRILEEASKQLKNFLDRKRRVDSKLARDAAVDFLERFFFKQIGRRPMILPVVVEV